MALGKINIFDNNWVEIVFKGRNQQYGAYELRKKSEEYTIKGIVYAIIFFTLVVSSPIIIGYIKGLVPKEAEEVKVVEVNTLEEPPPVDKNQPPPPPAEPPPPLKSTVKFTPPEIKPDEEVPDEPPPIQEDKREAAVKTEEGDPNGVDASLLGSGDGVVGEAAPEIMTFAEQMPEFNGDLSKYLYDNMKYPPNARENGIEGKVILQFVVGKDGKIDESSITVVKATQEWGLKEEAIRVLKGMPAWKPGKQNGNPVVVRCTLPITFKLDN